MSAGGGTGRRTLLSRIAPGLAFAALCVAVYAVPLFSRRNFTGRDLIAYNLPMEKSIHDAYARGRLPVWSAFVSGGRPLLPNPNAGALYPVRAALAVFPFPVAARLYPVLHWIAAGLGMLALAGVLGRSRAGAWIGAVTYVFSGVGVAEVFFPHIQPGMALLPWILWGVARPAAAAWHRALSLSCFFALDFLAGDVFTGGLAVASAALWIGIESRAETRKAELGALAAAVGLGALAAAPQIVATALWIPLTNRAVLGMKLSEAIYFSIHPLRLLELLVPYPFGNAWEMTMRSLWGWPLFHGRALGIFNTLYAGALAVVAVPVTWRARDPGARFGRLLVAAALAVSVLPSLLPIVWASGVSSPLPLRNPEKLAVAVVLGLSILAGLALDRIRAARSAPRWALAAGAVLAGLALVAAAAPGEAARLAVAAIGADRALGVPRARASLPLALSEAGLLWMATVVALEGVAGAARAGLVGGLALLTAVPIEANRRIARTLREEDVLGPTAFARYVSRNDPSGEYRTLGEALFRGGSALAGEAEDAALHYSDTARRGWTHLTPSLWNRGTVINEDFDVGDLSRVESLRKVASMATGFADSAPLFGSLSLKWGIRWNDQDPIAGYRRFAGDALQSWDEHAGALPDIRLAERWREVDGAIAALRVLPRLPGNAVVVESGREGEGAARPGSVRAVEKTPERMILEIDAADPGWLFVLRDDWPYRRIRLDGRPVESVPAQLAFSAVPVRAGRHVLVWEERAPGLAVSRWGPLLFGAAAVGLLVGRVRERAA